MQYLSVTDSNLSYVLSDVYVNFAVVVVGPLSMFTLRSENNMLWYKSIILQKVCNNYINDYKKFGNHKDWQKDFKYALPDIFYWYSHERKL